MKSILLSDIAIFSHFLVIVGLQMTIRMIFSWAGLTIIIIMIIYIGALVLATVL